MEEKEGGKRAYTRAHAFDLDIDIILAQLSNTILATSLANTHTQARTILLLFLSFPFSFSFSPFLNNIN